MNHRKQPNQINFGWVLLCCLLLLVGFSGCSYKKRNVLFKTQKKIETEGAPVFRVNYTGRGEDSLYLHHIQPDDRISVRFLNNYDITTGTSLTGGGNTGNELGFLVGTDGYVRLPIIGPVKVINRTRSEVASLLERLYSPHIKNPSIEVAVLNLTVSVMGEVEKPGLYELEKERTSLVEILAQANGITRYGKQKVVKIIRGDRKDPEIIIFDLTQIEAIGTEDLILHHNDIIYVEPKGIKLVGDAILPYTSLISAISALVLVGVTIQQRTR